MDAVITNSREMIRKGSKSFALAARLFDDDTRDHAYMLYAWCRHCDDEIDGQELGMARGRAQSALAAQPLNRAASLARLRAETRRALAGDALSDPVFVAFQRVARQHRIPERYALELLNGFEMDVGSFQYRTLEDTLLYCYRVAGVVGVMMALVMGVQESGALQRAADLGIAFQLTNIARDVLDDGRNGRCYLPAEWLAEAGVPSAALADPAHRQAVAGIVGRLLREADRYYESAGVGLQALPFRSAWAVATALGVYREIGRVVLERGPAAWDSRTVVSTPRKLGQVALGATRALRALTLDRWSGQVPRANDLWSIPDLSP